MATTYLQRTQTAGNQKTWTYSGWFKAINADAEQCIWSIDDGSDWTIVRLNSTGKLDINEYNGSYLYRFTSTQSYNDVGAWYHLVIEMDTTQSVEADRTNIYINGVKLTTWSTETYPTLNYVTRVGWNGTYLRIGCDDGTGNFFQGYQAQCVLTDGIAYAASTFGSTDSTTGEWSPNGDATIRSGVTFGTNGFLLSFENTSYLGYDYQTTARSTTNDFTTNGEPMPTLTNPSNNFCTLNDLVPYGSSVYAYYDAATQFSTSAGSVWRTVAGTTVLYKGKFYYEVKINTAATGNTYTIGWTSTNNLPAAVWTTYLGEGVNGPAVGLGKAGTLYYSTNSSHTQSDSGWTSYTNGGNIIMCAIDLDNNFMYFGLDGTWMKSGDPESGATGTGGFAFDNAATYDWLPALGSSEASGGSTPHMSCNFGEGYFANVSGAPTAITSAGTNASGLGQFEYDVPAGYTAICTKGLNE